MYSLVGLFFSEVVMPAVAEALVLANVTHAVDLVDVKDERRKISIWWSRRKINRAAGWFSAGEEIWKRPNAKYAAK